MPLFVKWLGATILAATILILAILIGRLFHA